MLGARPLAFLGLSQTGLGLGDLVVELRGGDRRPKVSPFSL